MALCPHCQHVLPDTPTLHCPNCGGALQPAGAPPPLPPAAGAPPVPPPLPPWPGGPTGGGASGPGIPWEDRARVGFFNALVETTRQVLLEPTAFFRAMPVRGGVGSPLLYAVVIGWVGLVAAALYQAVFRSVVTPRWPGIGAERPEVAAMLAWVEGWAGFVVQVVLGGVFVAIGVFIAAGILHVILLLFGGANRDFEATFRVVSFVQATSVLLLIPFCGQLVAAVWALVLYIIGLAEVHQISHGKAAAVVLLPIVLVCCCCAVLAMVFGVGIASLASQIR